MIDFDYRIDVKTKKFQIISKHKANQKILT